ncbi:hypothetical protein EJ02DRAFT_432275 [Clathrospora elynae]|uniref:SprT-like domain-containing protein n=1 Tax=Clathrospora elynae TaxID=706981 RepID=A0A6A5SY91_9PLEO|nr:hypothetical protein EJ02DRAFT_432275 [Clathrospora elynae]
MRPALNAEIDEGTYETLSLAECTIESFFRADTDMDPDHFDAQQQFKLSSKRGRLNDIFFVGVVRNLNITWNAKDLEAKDGTVYSDASTCLKYGRTHSTIRLHPTRRDQIKSEYVRNGQSLVETRVGTMLHEMLHVLLKQYAYAYEYCAVHVSHAGHGRAWQRIAEAIEEEGLMLLGVDVDLGACQA